jgi:hypothetical protein
MTDAEFEELVKAEAAAAATALEACYAYWLLYTKRRAIEGDYNTALIWLQNDENGHMMCFTRGEYAHTLRDCIAGVARLDRSNPFSLY